MLLLVSLLGNSFDSHIGRLWRSLRKRRSYHTELSRGICGLDPQERRHQYFASNHHLNCSSALAFLTQINCPLFSPIEKFAITPFEVKGHARIQ
jgi:hypothetical protein